MNCKKVQIVIHPLLGKTATTWLQTYAIKKLHIVNLGKGGKNDGTERFISPRLRKAQYNVFKPFYDEKGFWKTRYTNPNKALSEYTDILAEKINNHLLCSNEEILSFIISDETILSYGGIIPNTALLSAVITLLREKINTLHVEVHVVVTIREQLSYLKSFYAYDFSHQKKFYRTFDDFLFAAKTNPDHGPFSLLKYDDLYENLKLFLGGAVDSIKILPYELVKKDRQAFLLEFFEFAIKSDPKLKASILSASWDDSRMINSNHVKSTSGAEVNLIRKQTIFSKFKIKILSIILKRWPLKTEPPFTLPPAKYKFVKIKFTDKTQSLIRELDNYFKFINSKIYFIEYELLEKFRYVKANVENSEKIK